MPIRVKSRPAAADEGPRSPSIFAVHDFGGHLPDIGHDDTFREVIKELSIYISDVITLPSTFEQLRTTSVGDSLRRLVDHLSSSCTNPAIVNALLALKWHYAAAAGDKALNEARANSCEIVAWRFLTHLSEREAVDFCLYEIPDLTGGAGEEQSRDEEVADDYVDENTALLIQSWTDPTGSARRAANHTGSTRRYQLLQSISRLTMTMTGDDAEEEDPTGPFVNLNALEIAAIADAKRFLSQAVVQKIITGIWNGDIIFWDSLSVHATKKPRLYNHRTADVFSRLRVPKYLKSFEVLFFAVFLFLYYSVLVERNPDSITTREVLLYVWLAAFLYDELSEWIDAGSIFYAVDVWNVFDMIMMSIGVVFALLRIVGLSRGDAHMVDIAFDVLALEALFMVPRVCSILSLSPYWGTLIPCLKEMGKDFIKFMVLVVIIYLGFLTTFSLVGRGTYTFKQMTMVLAKIFYGSSSVGFDVMRDIDPIFGPPLMILFITLSSILLMGSLTGMLSNSFSRVITHAREEYLYVYSVYVLEASTSNRLTHFYPPFNLLALIFFRPLRLLLPRSHNLRAARILLLKATHLPVVGAIQLYELIRGHDLASFKGPTHHGGGGESSARSRSTPKRPRLVGQSARPSSSSQPGVVPTDDKDGAGDGATSDGTAGDKHGADARIAQLEAKIDRLTELVVNMYEQRSKTLGQVSVS